MDEKLDENDEELDENDEELDPKWERSWALLRLGNPSDPRPDATITLRSGRR
jgi:hypothetical protein